jgi:4-oxalocrotonate tautomerase
VAETISQISAVLREYFDGLYHSDTKRLARAFHREAIYVTATGGKLVFLRTHEYLPMVEQRESPADRGDRRTDRIVSIELAGPVTAFAHVECSILPRHFVDFLTLVKVEDRWQTISKVFHYDLGAQT